MEARKTLIVFSNSNSTANLIGIRYSTPTIITATLDVSGSGGQVSGLQATITLGSSPKQAFAYKLNDLAYSANGASTLTDTSSLIATVSQLNIGTNHSAANNLNGHIASIRYFKKRLANAKLQSITA
jgi:hypothetical protein